MVKKMVQIGILYDFYGKLLSKNQHTVIEFYYIHDLSLGEIGELLDISRQGVYDTLKRAENKLYDYEKKLGLVEKFKSINGDITIILKHIEAIINEAENLNNINIIKNAKVIKELAEKIIDNDQEVV